MGKKKHPTKQPSSIKPIPRRSQLILAWQASNEEERRDLVASISIDERKWLQSALDTVAQSELRRIVVGNRKSPMTIAAVNKFLGGASGKEDMSENEKEQVVKLIHLAIQELGATLWFGVSGKELPARITLSEEPPDKKRFYIRSVLPADKKVLYHRTRFPVGISLRQAE